MDAPDLWARALELVSGSASQTAMVEVFEIKSFAAGVARLGVSDPSKVAFAKAKAEWISALMSKAAGTPIRVEIAMDASPGGGESGGSSQGSQGEAPGGRGVEAESALRRKAMEQPLVKRAAELFGARIVAIENDENGA